MSFNILGTGSCVPRFVLTNDAVSQMMDTDDAWIRARTGIERRHIATTETMAELCENSAQGALQSAGIPPSALDLIVCATCEGDFATPSLACQIQKALGAACPAFDINAACSGFIYGLDVADAYISSGKADTVLVVASEMMSKHVDWTDRATCILFGDGAAAAVVGRGDGLLAIRLTARGDDKLLTIPSKSGVSPFDKKPHTPPILYMAGSEVFKFAVSTMCDDIRHVMDRAGIGVSDVDLFIPHQANARIIRSAAKTLGLPAEKTILTVQDYGNTSAVSIPLTLDSLIRGGRAKPGDIVIMSAFGGGLTSGACCIKL